MEQAIHLKDTEEKLDYALARLQEIQSALRGHTPLPGIADLDIPLKRPELPQLRRFDELGGIDVDQSAGDWRRWSTPAPLMHDALSEVLGSSKFAKKTVDMVKVQKKQAAKSTTLYTSRAKQASLLHPSNRVNLPQPVMAAPYDASGKTKSFRKENRNAHHQSKLDTKLQTEGGLRSLEKHKHGRDEASSSLHSGRPDRRASFIRVTPEEHVASSKIIQLRTLMNVEEAANDHHSHDQHDAIDCNTHPHDAPDHSMYQHDPIDHNTQGQQAASSVKRSSLSMRALIQMEDKEKTLSKPAFTLDKGKDIDSLSSSMSSNSFCVQLEEVKSSKKKPWSFSQGKASDNVVVMFPNPTFDETTPSLTPTDVKPPIDSTSLHEKVSTFPLTTMMNKAPSSDNKACIQKREKIVRLSPCSTTTNLQKHKPQPASTGDVVSAASKRASLKKQKWKCTLTQPPSPTLIRRLPETHEMKEVKQNRAPSTISPPSVFVGRPQNTNKGDEEDSYTLANADHDDADDIKTRKRSWSFGNLSTVDNTPSGSNARRSSLGPPAGGGSFSFLSKHFHAWKLAAKQDK